MTTTSTCGSCGAPIFWLKNEKTGKAAPINAESTDSGNITINTLTSTYRVLDQEDRRKVLAAFEKEGLTPPLHLNHFVACPQAPVWHKHGASGARGPKGEGAS